MRFRNQTVVITGAGGGIGQAICRAFHSEGARVGIADLPGSAGEAFARSLGDRALFVALDVTQETDWVDALDAVEAAFGSIDVVVNNAGYFQPNIAFEEMPLDVWRRHYAVNVDGTFLGCKHAIRRMMARRRGAIVNIGSGMSIKANPMASAYCGAKAAVLMTTRTAAASAGAYNIRVNAVLPGAVDTAMLMGNLVEGEVPAAYLDRMAQHSVLGRLATPEDIAHGVLMLADPASSAITGVFLPVDGGNLPGA